MDDRFHSSKHRFPQRVVWIRRSAACCSAFFYDLDVRRSLSHAEHKANSAMRSRLTARSFPAVLTLSDRLTELSVLCYPSRLFFNVSGSHQLSTVGTLCFEVSIRFPQILVCFMRSEAVEFRLRIVLVISKLVLFKRQALFCSS